MCHVKRCRAIIAKVGHCSAASCCIRAFEECAENSQYISQMPCCNESSHVIHFKIKKGLPGTIVITNSKHHFFFFCFLSLLLFSRCIAIVSIFSKKNKNLIGLIIQIVFVTMSLRVSSNSWSLQYPMEIL